MFFIKRKFPILDWFICIELKKEKWLFCSNSTSLHWKRRWHVSGNILDMYSLPQQTDADAGETWFRGIRIENDPKSLFSPFRFLFFCTLWHLKQTFLNIKSIKIWRLPPFLLSNDKVIYSSSYDRVYIITR